MSCDVCENGPEIVGAADLTDDEQGLIASALILVVVAFVLLLVWIQSAVVVNSGFATVAGVFS